MSFQDDLLQPDALSDEMMSDLQQEEATQSWRQPLQNRRFFLSSLFGASALVGTGAWAWLAETSPVFVKAVASAASYHYTFATFLGNAASQEKLSIYTSTDGLHFSLRSNTGYAGPTGVLRDPSIMKHTDGRYYITYTPESFTTTNTNFGIASSSDLIHWTYLTSVSSPIAHTSHVWAPEWFKDTNGSVNILVAIDDSSNETDFRIFKYTATNSALTAWSGATPLSGLSANHIDPFIVKVNGVYNAFVKNGTTNYIERATATNLTGPYTFVGTGNWAGWGQNLEGPAVYPLDNGNWRIFMDGYTVGKFYYSDSSNLQTWTGKQELPNGLSGVVRHGTVLAESNSGSTTYKLVNRNSGKVLDVTGQSTANGALVQQWTDNGGANQHWTLTSVSGGHYTLVNVNSGKLLDVTGQSTANGTQIIQQASSGSTSQQWNMVSLSGGYYKFVNVNSGKNLDVSGGSTADGAKVIQWTDNGGTNQQWSVVQV